MPQKNDRLSLEIRNRPCELEGPEVGSGRELKLFDGILDECILFLPKQTELCDIAVIHFGIEGLSGSGESLQLDRPGLQDLLFRFDAAHALFRAFIEFLDLHPRYFDEEVDPVEDRSGEFFPITLTIECRADALLLLIVVESAWARVQRSYEDEFRRIPIGGVDPIDGDLTIFHRLPERFDETGIEFQELIEEEDSFMGQAYLSGARIPSSSHDTHDAGGMMDPSEGPCRDERMVLRKKSGY